MQGFPGPNGVLTLVATVCLISFTCTNVHGIAHSNDDAGSCGQGLTCGPDCQLLCVEMHNYYRKLHGSPPMKCDPELAKSAQEWTDEQAKVGNMHHSEWTDKFTESISWKGWGWEGMEKMEGAIPGATRSWYSEIKNDYNYGTGKGNGKAIGHFQAVVWKAETKIGCGLNIKKDDGTFVTAHYAPASHASSDHDKFAPGNVTKRNDPEPTCDIRSSEREDCNADLQAPLVTPDECTKAGCCYDDMFMSESSLKFYDKEGRKWCFVPKGGAKGPTTAPVSNGTTGTSKPTTAPGSKGTTGASKPTAAPGANGTTEASKPTAAPGANGTTEASKPTAAPGANGTTGASKPTTAPSANGTTGPTTPSGGKGTTKEPTTAPGATNGTTEAPKGGYKGDSCYTLFTVGATWAEGRDKCKGEGGELIAIESDGEWSYIKSLISLAYNSFNNEWHIGLEKKGHDWLWMNGTPLKVSVRMSTNSTGEDEGNYGSIVALSGDGMAGAFKVQDGNNKLGVICEKKPDGKCATPAEQM